LRFRLLTTGDLPVIIGVTIAASVAVVSANVLVDFGYAMIDPRVRVQ
jgi:peptide/nickel transport system permease protein